MDSSSNPPTTLRDAFYRVAQASSPTYRIILAEEATPLTADAGYGDLLSFESDIAQVVGLILLFAESAGSLAELGAFAALKTVAPSLLAILDDFYYGQSSFIRNGPVKFLENEYGDDWILVIERGDLGIGTGGSNASLDAVKLGAAIMPAIDKRLARRNVFEKFDPSNNGHVILLMTGLCKEFGALTITEIHDHLLHLGLPAITRARLRNYIYCSELLGWLATVRKGNHIFYVAAGGGSALDYSLEPAVAVKDKVRWRTDIRSFWLKNDPARMRAITEVLSSTPGQRP